MPIGKILTAFSIIGGVVGAFQQVGGALAKNAAVKRNNAIAQRNAEIAAQNQEYQARIARQNRDAELRRQRRELDASGRRFNLAQGRQIAQAGALGGNLFGGPLADILADTEGQRLLEYDSIIDERTSAAVSHENQARAFDARADQARASYTPDRTNYLFQGVGNAAGSLLSGFGRAASISSSFGGGNTGGGGNLNTGSTAYGTDFTSDPSSALIGGY